MLVYNTRDVARLLDVSVARLTKAIWYGRVDPPPKSPSGTYLWTVEDIDRASWQLLSRPFKLGEHGL